MPLRHIRDHFPIFEAYPNWVYLDSTATTQKPKSVIDTMTAFDASSYATVHRGVYHLSQEATELCENVRQQVATFIHAERSDEIIFTKGTTESINLVAATYGRTELQEGDAIVITHMEHHANIVPWQRLCEEKGLTLRVVKVTDEGLVDEAYLAKCLKDDVKLFAVVHVSNVLGTINPVKKWIGMAKSKGIAVLVDGAQMVAHHPVNVRDLDCDFYCFSSHKMYGPTGLGILYAKYDLLERMPPYQSGGDMIETVTFDKTTYAKPPYKFEAGTPAITQIVGLGAAVTFIQSLGFEVIQDHERKLLEQATKALRKVKGLTLLGDTEEKDAILSFVLDGIHPHDAGTVLDEDHIAVRVGHHCAQPLMQRLNVAATIRASFCIYNKDCDIELLLKGIYHTQKVLL